MARTVAVRGRNWIDAACRVPGIDGASAAPVTHTSPRRSAVIAFLFATPAATLAAFVFGAIEGGMNLLPVYGMHVGKGETIAILLAAVALGIWSWKYRSTC